MAAPAPSITPTVKQNKPSCVCSFYQEGKRFPTGPSPVDLCVCVPSGQELCVLDRSSYKGGGERGYLAKDEAHICHDQKLPWGVPWWFSELRIRRCHCCALVAAVAQVRSLTPKCHRCNGRRRDKKEIQPFREILLKFNCLCLGRALTGEALGNLQPYSCRSQEGRGMTVSHCDEQEQITVVT